MMTREEAIARLDPELSAFLARPSDDLTKIPLDEARAKAEAFVRAIIAPPQVPPLVHVIKSSGDQCDIEVRVHLPLDKAPSLAVLHIHGGGMVMGSAASYDGRTAALAQSLGAVIVAVNYRKAPETAFPGPLLDCVSAWEYVIEQAPNWGLGAQNCVITGDSAGGGLAAATCLYVRDHGGVMPTCQVLVFPMLDYMTGLGDDPEKDHRLGWNSANNQFGWTALLGDQPLPTGEALGHFSPAHAQNFAGLPPTWIGVGDVDLFFEENVAFATALARSGVETSLNTYAGAPHGFPALPSGVSRRFIKDYQNAFLRWLA